MLKIACIHLSSRSKKTRFCEDVRKSLNMIHNRNATFYLDETNKGAVIDDLSHVQYPICTKHIKVKYDLKYKSIICYCNVHVYLNITNKKNIFHNKIVFLHPRCPAWISLCTKSITVLRKPAAYLNFRNEIRGWFAFQRYIRFFTHSVEYWIKCFTPNAAPEGKSEFCFPECLNFLRRSRDVFVNPRCIVFKSHRCSEEWFHTSSLTSFNLKH